MRHNKNCAALEAFTESSLDKIIGLEVDVGCSFIKNQYSCLADDGSGEAQQLLLSDREQVVALSNVSVYVLGE